MTEKTFHQDSYLANHTATVIGHSPEGGVILDRTIFFPTGGGQPGDCGRLEINGDNVPIATAIKGAEAQIVLIPGAPVGLPPIGSDVVQILDWDRRYAHMRIHSALHLLSVAVPLPVSGGAISTEKGRLDFDMPDASIDRDDLSAEINRMIDLDLPIVESWITDAQLRADPGLVKTMSVMPPMGQGRVRMIGIGEGSDRIDLQPCGGTHVARTGEIGSPRIGKIQNKGRQNRRIYIHLED